MWAKLDLFLLLQVTLICWARALLYEFIPENRNLLQNCENEPENVLGFGEAFNMTGMIIQSTENTPIVHMSGNIITNWPGVEQSDLISFTAKLYHYEYNAWQPTMYSVATKNFCQDLFDKSSYWYKYYTKNISNAAKVKEICVKSFDGLVEHNAFDLVLNGQVPYTPKLAGRKKLIILFEAFDENKMKRPISICTEIVGVMRQA